MTNYNELFRGIDSLTGGGALPKPPDDPRLRFLSSYQGALPEPNLDPNPIDPTVDPNSFAALRPEISLLDNINTQAPAYSQEEGLVSRAIDRGALGVASTLWGSAEAISSALGLDGMEDAFRRMRVDSEMAAQLNPPEVGGLEDVGGPVDFGDYMTERMIEGLVQFGPMVGGGALGAGIAAARAGQGARLAAASTGFKAGGVTAGYAQNVGEAQSELYNAGIDRPGAAILSGIPRTAVDFAAFDRIVRKIIPGVGAEQSKDIAGRAVGILKAAGLGAGTEAPTEMIQEAMLMATRASVDPTYDPYTKSGAWRLADAFLAGAAGGAGLSGIGRLGSEIVRPDNFRSAFDAAKRELDNIHTPPTPPDGNGDLSNVPIGLEPEIDIARTAAQNTRDVIAGRRPFAIDNSPDALPSEAEGLVASRSVETPRGQRRVVAQDEELAQAGATLLEKGILNDDELNSLGIDQVDLGKKRKTTRETLLQNTIEAIQQRALTESVGTKLTRAVNNNELSDKDVSALGRVIRGKTKKARADAEVAAAKEKVDSIRKKVTGAVKKVRKRATKTAKKLQESASQLGTGIRAAYEEQRQLAADETAARLNEFNEPLRVQASRLVDEGRAEIEAAKDLPQAEREAAKVEARKKVREGRALQKEYNSRVGKRRLGLERKAETAGKAIAEAPGNLEQKAAALAAIDTVERAVQEDPERAKATVEAVKTGIPEVDTLLTSIVSQPSEVVEDATPLADTAGWVVQQQPQQQPQGRARRRSERLPGARVDFNDSAVQRARAEIKEKKQAIQAEHDNWKALPGQPVSPPINRQLVREINELEAIVAAAYSTDFLNKRIAQKMEKVQRITTRIAQVLKDKKLGKLDLQFAEAQAALRDGWIIPELNMLILEARARGSEQATVKPSDFKSDVQPKPPPAPKTEPAAQPQTVAEPEAPAAPVQLQPVLASDIQIDKSLLKDLVQKVQNWRGRMRTPKGMEAVRQKHLDELLAMESLIAMSWAPDQLKRVIDNKRKSIADLAKKISELELSRPNSERLKYWKKYRAILNQELQSLEEVQANREASFVGPPPPTRPETELRTPNEALQASRADPTRADVPPTATTNEESVLELFVNLAMREGRLGVLTIARSATKLLNGLKNAVQYRAELGAAFDIMRNIGGFAQLTNTERLLLNRLNDGNRLARIRELQRATDVRRKKSTLNEFATQLAHLTNAEKVSWLSEAEIQQVLDQLNGMPLDEYLLEMTGTVSLPKAMALIDSMLVENRRPLTEQANRKLMAELRTDFLMDSLEELTGKRGPGVVKPLRDLFEFAEKHGLSADAIISMASVVQPFRGMGLDEVLMNLTSTTSMPRAADEITAMSQQVLPIRAMIQDNGIFDDEIGEQEGIESVDAMDYGTFNEEDRDPAWHIGIRGQKSESELDVVGWAPATEEYAGKWEETLDADMTAVIHGMRSLTASVDWDAVQADLKRKVIEAVGDRSITAAFAKTLADTIMRYPLRDISVVTVKGRFVIKADPVTMEGVNDEGVVHMLERAVRLTHSVLSEDRDADRRWAITWPNGESSIIDSFVIAKIGERTTGDKRRRPEFGDKERPRVVDRLVWLREDFYSGLAWMMDNGFDIHLDQIGNKNFRVAPTKPGNAQITLRTLDRIASDLERLDREATELTIRIKNLQDRYDKKDPEQIQYSREDIAQARAMLQRVKDRLREYGISAASGFYNSWTTQESADLDLSQLSALNPMPGDSKQGLTIWRRDPIIWKTVAGQKARLMLAEANAVERNAAQMGKKLTAKQKEKLAQLRKDAQELIDDSPVLGRASDEAKAAAARRTQAEARLKRMQRARYELGLADGSIQAPYSQPGRKRTAIADLVRKSIWPTPFDRRLQKRLDDMQPPAEQVWVGFNKKVDRIPWVDLPHDLILAVREEMVIEEIRSVHATLTNSVLPENMQPAVAMSMLNLQHNSDVPFTLAEVQEDPTDIVDGRSRANVLASESLSTKAVKAALAAMEALGLHVHFRVLDRQGVEELGKEIAAQIAEIDEAAKNNNDPSLSRKRAQLERQRAEMRNLWVSKPSGRILYQQYMASANDRVPIIYIDSSLNEMQQLAVLGHELGHLVQKLVYDSAPAATRKAIRDRYGDLNDAQFAEAFADDFTRYWKARNAVKSTVDKFFVEENMLFDRMIKALRSLWRALRRVGKLNSKYSEFMDGVVGALNPDAGIKPKTPFGKNVAAYITTTIGNKTWVHLPYDGKLDSAQSHDYGPQQQMGMRQRLSALSAGIQNAYGNSPQTQQAVDATIKQLRTFGKLMAPLVQTTAGRIRALHEVYKDRTPIFKEIHDHFYHMQSDQNRTVAETIHEEMQRKSGKVYAMLNELAKTLAPPTDFERVVLGRQFSGRVTDMEKRALELLRREVPADQWPADLLHLRDAARTILDYLYAVAQDHGVNFPRRAEYWPKVIDVEKWTAQEERIKELLVTEAGYSPQQAQEEFQRIRDRNIHADIAAVQEAAGPNFGFNDRPNYWDIPAIEQELNDLLVDDIVGTLTMYATQTYRRSIMMRRFNPNNEVNDDGRLDPLHKLRVRLRALRQAQNGLTEEDYREIMEKLMPMLLGTYRRDLAEKMRGMNSIMMFYQNIRILTFAVISSFVDVGQLSVRYGVETQGFFGGLKNGAGMIFQHLMDSPENRMRWETMARDIGAIRDDLAEHILSDQMQANFLLPSVARMSDGYFRFIRLQQWTNLTRVAALRSAHSFIEEHKRKATEDNDPISIGHLRELGFQLTNDGLITNDNPTVNKTALNRWIDGAILRPQAGMRPGWANDPRFLLIWHLKQYMWGVGDVIVRRIWQQTKNNPGLWKLMPIAFAATAMLSLSALGYELRRQIAYATADRVPPRPEGFSYVTELLDRSGMTGPLQLLLDADQARQYDRSAFVAMLGPTAQWGEVLVKKDLPYILSVSTPLLSSFGAYREAVR